MQLHGHFTVETSYELENDNLMALSHPEFLHAGSIGSDGHHSAIYEAIQESDTRVHSNRWYAEGPARRRSKRSFRRVADRWSTGPTCAGMRHR